MAGSARKFVRVTKFLLAGVTVFCVSWIACVNEWHYGVRWSGSSASGSSMTTMRTIVAYSEGKLAELEKPSPVTCDRLPALPKIPHIDRTWYPGVTSPSPWQHVPGTGVFLYSAYYDERTQQRYVRILARFEGRNISREEPLFCQTRLLNSYEDSVEVVAARPTEIWWHEWDTKSSHVETPLLLSCPLTDSLNGPSVVSLVTQPCDDPTNGFLLEPIRRKINRTFTVCVKDVNFKNDISQSLVEWIEMNRILGANMIDVYVDEVSMETEKVLLYYKTLGFIRLYKVPIKNVKGRTLWQRRRDHIITYNDCLYRNIIESEYVVPLDVDEIILPKIANDWQALIQRLNNHGLNKTSYSAILIRNVFFFDFLQDVKAKKQVSKNKIYTKRDDVRISAGSGDFSSIEFVGDIKGLNNEVLDRYINKEFYDKYKSRCGRDMGVPKLARHIIRSADVSPAGFYSKSMMLTKKVLTAFNHYPLASLGTTGFAGWTAPFDEVQLNHYKESCNMTIVVECDIYGRRARIDRSALRLRKRLEEALSSAICTETNKT